MIKYSNNVVLNKIYNWLDRLVGYSEDSVDAHQDEGEEDVEPEPIIKVSRTSNLGQFWKS